MTSTDTYSSEEELNRLVSQDTSFGRTPVKLHSYFPADSTHRYGIYAVGIDRFILVDRYDLWNTLTCAKLLSSKLVTIVYSIPNTVRELRANTEQPLLYTIGDNLKETVRQSDTQMTKLHFLNGHHAIKKTGMPHDFESPDRVKVLVELQNYALYVQKILYALRVSDAKANIHDHVFFSSILGDTDIKNTFDIRPDVSLIDNGITNSIMGVLYLSQSIEQAEEGISEVWQRSRGHREQFRNHFYKLLNLEPPKILDPIDYVRGI